MQNDGQFGGSTPSIYIPQTAHNYDHSDSNKSDYAKLFDHSAGQDGKSKSERSYYDVDKIDFDKSIYLNGPPHSSESSSSDNSIFSDSREHDTDNQIIMVHDDTDDNETIICARKNPSILPRCKNSTENLSEDSGYGEFNTLRHRSKSIPSFNQDYFIEEEELENHKSLENVYACSPYCLDGMANKSTMVDAASTFIHIRATTSQSQRPKIEAAKRNSGSAALAASSPYNESKNIRGHGEVQHRATDASRKVASSASASSISSLQNIISASLPDILDHISVFGEINQHHLHQHSENCEQRKCTTTQTGIHNSHNNSSDLVTPFYNRDLSIVSSVPNNLNICSDRNNSNNGSGVGGYRDDIDCWSFNSVSISSRHASGSVASKNFDLGNFECRANGGSGSIALNDQQFRQQKIINASYSNLTLLDYSGGSGNRTPLGSSLRIMAEKQKRSSLEFGRGSSLLDEISAHFDRDLSIMNDQKRNYDPSDIFSQHQRCVVTRPTQPPPQPPPRRQFSVQKNDTDAMDVVEPLPQPVSSSSSAFEISHMEARFSDSLEDCKYDSDASTDIELDEEECETLPAAQSTPIKREFIASTPNLYLVKRDCGEDFMPICSAHNSMTTLLQNGLQDKGRSILSDRSRNSLGKGVSFCPIVAEISWREQSSEEGVESTGNESR